jgi:hypothetical protein
MADRRRCYRDYALLAGSLAGMITYLLLTGAESLGGSLCPKPSGRSVEDLFAPCQSAEMRLAELQARPAEPGRTVLAGIRHQLFGDLKTPPRTDLAKAAPDDVTATGSIDRR